LSSLEIDTTLADLAMIMKEKTTKLVIMRILSIVTRNEQLFVHRSSFLIDLITFWMVTVILYDSSYSYLCYRYSNACYQFSYVTAVIL